MSAQEGMSFTEFTYQLLQGYDFYELYRTLGCTIQVGGSDQWGNILSGLELINKTQLGETSQTTNEKGFALTTPLLTNSSGQKFGKSAGNAVWLDENLTSYLDFYQVGFVVPRSYTSHANELDSSSSRRPTQMLADTSGCLLYYRQK